MDDCIFCKITSGGLPTTKIFENEKVFAFMDIKPINQGHVLVIPKKHAKLIVEVEDEIVSEIFKVAKAINLAIRNSGIKCGGVNYFLADGKAAGQEVPHAHLHIFPRFENDGFGFRFSKAYEKLPSRKELEEAASKIKKEL